MSETHSPPPYTERPISLEPQPLVSVQLKLIETCKNVIERNLRVHFTSALSMPFVLALATAGASGLILEVVSLGRLSNQSLIQHLLEEQQQQQHAATATAAIAIGVCFRLLGYLFALVAGASIFVLSIKNLLICACVIRLKGTSTKNTLKLWLLKFAPFTFGKLQKV